MAGHEVSVCKAVQRGVADGTQGNAVDAGLVADNVVTVGASVGASNAKSLASVEATNRTTVLTNPSQYAASNAKAASSDSQGSMRRPRKANKASKASVAPRKAIISSKNDRASAVTCPAGPSALSVNPFQSLDHPDAFDEADILNLIGKRICDNSSGNTHSMPAQDEDLPLDCPSMNDVPNSVRLITDSIVTTLSAVDMAGAKRPLKSILKRAAGPESTEAS